MWISRNWGNTKSAGSRCEMASPSPRPTPPPDDLILLTQQECHLIPCGRDPEIARGEEPRTPGAVQVHPRLRRTGRSLRNTIHRKPPHATKSVRIREHTDRPAVRGPLWIVAGAEPDPLCDRYRFRPVERRRIHGRSGGRLGFEHDPAFIRREIGAIEIPLRMARS